VKLALVAFLCACSSAPDAVPTDAGKDVAKAPKEDASAPDDVVTVVNPSVSGVVTDTKGAPWPDAKVQVCSDALCTLGNADGTGAFSVQVPAGKTYHVMAHPPASDPREGSTGIAELADILTTDVTLPSPVAIPITGAHASLPNAAVTQDLTLTANAPDVSFTGDAYFSGVAVTSSPFASSIATWALNPWATRTNAGKTIAVTMSNTFGLSPGDTVSVYAVNETTAELVGPSTGTVSSDGKTITGATIDRVTWIVVTH
jgi:hypothetical protein